MIKKLLVSIFLFLLVSCGSIQKGDINTNTFYKFVAREQYMKEAEPDRVFNPDSAVLISTMPNKIGNMKFAGSINDYEIANNGLGYSKRYKSNKVKKGYWIDVFTFHMRQTGVSSDLNNEIVNAVYKNAKNETLKSHNNSKILEENTLIFVTPANKSLKMRELIFEYTDNDNKIMTGYLYFGTILDSFFKVRVNYYSDFNLESDKDYFIKDFAYYQADGMSLNDYNDFKKSEAKNPIKIKRERYGKK